MRGTAFLQLIENGSVSRRRALLVLVHHRLTQRHFFLRSRPRGGSRLDRTPLHERQASAFAVQQVFELLTDILVA